MINDETERPDDLETNTEDTEPETEADPLGGLSIYDIIEQQNDTRQTAEEMTPSDADIPIEAEVEAPLIEAIDEPVALEGQADIEMRPDSPIAEPVDTEPMPEAEVEASVTITVQTDAEDAETEDEVMPPPAPVEPEEPEWKVLARKIYEEREAKRLEMIESRRSHEMSWIQARREEEAQRAAQKREADASLKAQVEADRRERQNKFDEMMAQMRAERERKQQERAAMDRQLRQKREQRSYQAPAVPPAEPAAAPPPTRSSPPTNLEERLSRLSKPEEPDTPPTVPEDDAG